MYPVLRRLIRDRRAPIPSGERIRFRDIGDSHQQRERRKETIRLVRRHPVK